MAADAAVRGPTLLFVEDNAELRTLASIALEPKGHRVLAAADGRAALEIFSNCHDRIDVAVVDLILPDMTGIDLIAQFTALDDSVPVLVTSGMGGEWSKSALRAGAVEFISKPYSLSDLSRQIAEATSSRAAVG